MKVRSNIEGQNKEELQYLLFHKSAADPALIPSAEGQFYYNTASKAIKYKNATSWVFLPYMTASVSADTLLLGNGLRLKPVFTETGGFVKANIDSTAYVQELILMADLDPSMVCTVITAPGLDTWLVTEKAVVDYVASEISALPSVSVAGNNTEIQYNDSGSFGASSQFTWDDANSILEVQGINAFPPKLRLRNTSNLVNVVGDVYAANDGTHVTSTVDVFLDSSGSVEINAVGDLLIAAAAIGISNGTASKFLYLDANKEITYVDAIASADISGTSGYLSKFTGTHTLGDSILFEDSSKVGVNTAAPAYTFDVNGQLNVTSTVETVTLSAEMNTNPTGWTTGANWTNNLNGSYTCTTNSGALSYNIPVVSGRRYIVTYSATGTYQNYCTGTLNTLSQALYDVNTTKSFDLLSSWTSTVTFKFQFSSVAAVTISNISIKELTPTTSAYAASFVHTTSSGIGAELRSNVLLYSIGLGVDSLKYLYTGTNNSAFGYQAGINLTTGFNNTPIGYKAMYGMLTGHDNVAVGAYALDGAPATVKNTVVGSSAGRSLTTGHSNTLIGYGAGASLITGTLNTYIGLGSATGDSSYSVGVGAYSGGGASYGVAVGVSSSQGTTGGTYNVCVGYQARIGNGSSNVGIGYQPFGAGGASGSYNAVIGGGAAGTLTSGTNNVLLGYYAGQSITTGGGNVVAGVQYPPTITTGSRNVQIGMYQRPAIISNDLFAIPTRLHQSTEFSSDADNLFLGYGATKQKPSGVISKSVAIGAYSRVYQDNQVAIGSDFITSTLINGDVEIRNCSVLASNSLQNGTLQTLGTGEWAVTGDMALINDKATYTHSTGSGSIEQLEADYDTPIRPNTWYKLSYTTTGNPSYITGTITSDMNGYSIPMYMRLVGTSYIYFKTGASTPKVKMTFTSSSSATSFSLTLISLEEVIGGDLYINRNLEQRRGSIQYFRQNVGTDTDGDWRMYADGSGFYIDYYNAGWVNKHTVTP